MADSEKVASIKAYYTGWSISSHTNKSINKIKTKRDIR